MSEQHSDSPSLTPWGRDTEYYEGYDDGGQLYCLPAGFSLGRTMDEGEAIFCAGEDFACDLVKHSSGRPQVITLSHGCPVLELAGVSLNSIPNPNDK